MSKAKEYWFPAKRYGWGWGFPIAWQGKVVLFAFFALIAVGAITLLPNKGAITFVVYCGILNIVLIAV